MPSPRNIGEITKTHGMSKSREYRIWKGIRTRCNNKNSPNYRNYGAIGIKRCKRWDRFENFIKDMGFAPSENHSIDRINYNLGYFKKNCRWATHKEQARNRRTAPLIEYNGQIKTPAEWAEIVGIHRKTIMRRIRRGMPTDKVLTYCKPGSRVAY